MPLVAAQVDGEPVVGDLPQVPGPDEASRRRRCRGLEQSVPASASAISMRGTGLQLGQAPPRQARRARPVEHAGRRRWPLARWQLDGHRVGVREALGGGGQLGCGRVSTGGEDGRGHIEGSSEVAGTGSVDGVEQLLGRFGGAGQIAGGEMAGGEGLQVAADPERIVDRPGDEQRRGGDVHRLVVVTLAGPDRRLHGAGPHLVEDRAVLTCRSATARTISSASSCRPSAARS